MKSNPTSVEKRYMKRWHLIFYLRVFNRDTEELLGHIVNINTEGIMLVSDKPIAANENYQLWLEIPGEGDARERLSLEAQSLWCSSDVNPDFFDTGFRLINANSETLLKIQLLIDDLRLYE